MPLSWVVIDFETASASDLRRVGAWRYSEDPTTEVLCCAISYMGGAPEIWYPGDPSGNPLVAYAQDSSVTFIAHNVAFEKAIWRNIMVPSFGLPDVPNARWHDSMAACAMRVVPLKLERVAPILGLSSQKDKEGKKAVLAMSKTNKAGYYDRSPETLVKAYAYCKQDIRTEVALHECVGWLPPGERKVWLLDQRINERGVALDLDYIQASRDVVQQATVPLASEFRNITNGLDFSQRDKVMAWVAGEGVSIPDLRKETLEQILGADEEDDDNETDAGDSIALPGHVRRALAIRRLIGSASIKKLARMEECVCGDGRARGLLQYHGAGPGRWAGRILQPQNFPRGSIRVDGEAIDVEPVVQSILTRDANYVETICGPAVETVVGGLRHALVPGHGRLFVSGDFSTIEARVVLAIAGEHGKLSIMSQGGDIYCDMASQIFGRPITKKDKPERQTGKNSVLGLGFQMGWEKFRNRYGEGQDDEFFKRVVNTYRTEWAPGVPKVWTGLENASRAAVWDKGGRAYEAFGVTYQRDGRWLTARLPSGRRLWYYNPQAVMRAMPWDPEDKRPAWTYQALKMGQWRTIDAYGGLETENVVQALARDLLVCAMFKCEKENLPIVLTVHDEIVVEPEAALANEKMLAQIMADSPDWARELKIPIGTETWIGDRYKK